MKAEAHPDFLELESPWFCQPGVVRVVPDGEVRALLTEGVPLVGAQATNPAMFNTDGGLGIRVKLSHTELANGLGVARRSIARTLTTWVKQGLLEKSKASYVVRDLQGLARFGSQELVGVDWVAGSKIDEGRTLGPRHR